MLVSLFVTCMRIPCTCVDTYCFLFFGECCFLSFFAPFHSYKTLERVEHTCSTSSSEHLIFILIPDIDFKCIYRENFFIDIVIHVGGGAG